MRKSLLLVLLLSLLSVGAFGYIASQLLPVRDQVAVRQNIQFGDPSALNGLTVSLLTESDNILHWNTTIETGTDVNAVTDYTYTLPPEKVDSRREQTNWLTISPSIWSIPTLQELFLEEGAQFAFNLDGGGSTTLYFLGEVINMPSGGKERSVSDVLMFMANPQ